MAKFQLISRDEYNQASIIGTSENITELIKKAKEQITDINVNNALTETDREKSWEAFMVLIEGEDDTDYYYGGPLIGSDKTIYCVSKEGENEVSLAQIPDAKIKIYLGDIMRTGESNKKEWYAASIVNREPKLITDLSHRELQGKTMFYLKKA